MPSYPVLCSRRPFFLLPVLRTFLATAYPTSSANVQPRVGPQVSSSFFSSSSSDSMSAILSRLSHGKITPFEAETELLQLQPQIWKGAAGENTEKAKGYDSVESFAKVDISRAARTGLPEVSSARGENREAETSWPI